VPSTYQSTVGAGIHLPRRAIAAADISDCPVTVTDGWKRQLEKSRRDQDDSTLHLYHRRPTMPMSYRVDDNDRAISDHGRGKDDGRG
jgi:hypothetical protein